MTAESLNSLANASFTGATVIPNSSIWHDGVAQNSTLDYKSLLTGSTQHIDIGEVSVIKRGFIQNSTTEIGSSEIGSIKSTLVKSGIYQDRINQDSFVQSSFGYVRSSKIGSSEIGSGQKGREKSISNVSPTEVSSLLHFGSFKVSPFQVGSTQVDINKDGTAPISTTQVSTAQVNANKFISLQVQGFAQIDSAKVSLSSLVTLPQFSTTHLTTHDLTPEYLSQLQSSLATYWDLPTNLNLPNGQIAVREALRNATASINGYGNNGCPNPSTGSGQRTATISIYANYHPRWIDRLSTY